MTGKWNKCKAKKPLETSLGQAPKELPEKLPDLSHLRKPMGTSVVGLKQVFDLFENATAEVQDYISHECDILYECRVCRSIFRSLANFILHKRSFCKEKHDRGPGFDTGGFVVDSSREGTPIEKVGSGESSPELEKLNKKSTLMPIIDKLLKRHEIDDWAKSTLNKDLSDEGKADNSDDEVVFVPEENDVVLERIDENQEAVFQTRVANQAPNTGLLKSEVMEIHGILNNNEAVLGSNGKVCNFETNKVLKGNIPPKNLVCIECNFTFSSLKTLTYHIKYKHNKTCTVYPCPDCRQTFSNAWSVYRHLFKVHKRTNAQVRRMRPQIHAGRIRKEQVPEEEQPVTEKEENEENQWMNNIEGDKDFQMCGGCGKRFERKAALQSHSLMCVKRIAICNNINKERKNKTKSPEKSEKPEEVKILKGAAKRKPKFVRSHVTEDTVWGEVGEVTITKQTDATVPETAAVPEIEIFTISDDSCDAENGDSDEFKAYVNDETDYCFLEKAAPYMAKDELKCVPCSDTFFSPYQLLWHMSLHFSWFRFQCSKCSFSSFNKYDCTAHAHTSHGTPYNLMGNRVLPIPKWKVLSTSHDFKDLRDNSNNNDINAEDQAMPELEMSEPCEEKAQEPIVLEDEEMPDICSSAQIILCEEKPGPSAAPASTRPVRNRTRSIKTVQNDFIYDLGKALKLNDSSVKAGKLKKNVK